jgi:hypothetical protein
MNKRLEYLLAFAALIWGLVVFNPWSDAFTSSITFVSMAKVASELTWGILLTSIGVSGIITTKCGHVLSRQIYLLLNMSIWIVLSVFYFLGNPQGTGFIPYAILAMIAFTIFIDVR